MEKIADFTNKSVPLDNFFGGSFDVADTATTTTPISIPGTSTFIKLTNNGLGVQTNNNFAPIGITELWDPTNNEFDFSQLKLGDIVTIRIDLDVDIQNNDTEVEVRLQAGIGVFTFNINWDQRSYKAVQVAPLAKSSFVTMVTAAILDGTAEFQLKADKACAVTVRGWNYTITRRG